MTENPTYSAEQIRHLFRTVARLSLENGTLEYRAMKAEAEAAEAKRLATIDPLTGAYNRLGGNMAFEILHSNAMREEKVLSLIMLDLDHFKSVNDTYGHKAGDMILKETVRRMIEPKAGESAVLREGDLMIRRGGEEFAIVVQIDEAAQAQKIAERCRKAIQTKPFAITNKDDQAMDINVTASFGVGLCAPQRDAACDMEEMAGSADKALYIAKETGRNKVVVSEAEAIKAQMPAQQKEPVLSAEERAFFSTPMNSETPENAGTVHKRTKHPRKPFMRRTIGVGCKPSFPK